MEKKGFFANLNQYFSDVRAELHKVTWPTKEDIIRYTLIVLGFSFFFAIVLGGLDAVIFNVIQYFVAK